MPADSKRARSPEEEQGQARGDEVKRQKLGRAATVPNASTEAPPTAVQPSSASTSSKPGEDGIAAAAFGTVQPYDVFLVADLETTCVDGIRDDYRMSMFDWPQEITEWPVVLLRWKDKNPETRRASELEVVDTFRSFVRPTWRPQLSKFCIDFTGVTQEQVDASPTFPELMEGSFAKFMEKHGLFDFETRMPLVRYVWCTDGPWDICRFVLKQCFISNIDIPDFFGPKILNVRELVKSWHSKRHKNAPQNLTRAATWAGPEKPKFSIESQLEMLGLGTFQGRQHCGLDDTKNIVRIFMALAKQCVRLVPNTTIDLGLSYAWMGQTRGQILEDQVF